MARPIRLQLAGAHYLVTARAASPDSLFMEEQDRARFVDLLGRSCQRYRWRCHAWCLGTDYYQLLIALERPNLATGMRHLNSVHSQTLHRHRRVGGQLFEGRYDSQFVDPDTSLFAAAADLLRQPVLAGLVTDVRDWPWSSYHATVGTHAAPEWFTRHELLRRFDDDPERAAAAFDRALREQPRLHEVPCAGRVYADAEFIARLVASAPVEDRATPLYGRPRPPLRELSAAHPDRREAMRVAYRSGYSQKEIARYFNVHTATVSRAVAAGMNWPHASTTSPLTSQHARD